MQQDVGHFQQDIRVGPVEIPLEVPECCPHPRLHLLHPGEVARRHCGEDLGQGRFVGIGHGAVGEGQVQATVVGGSQAGLDRPLVLGAGVVHDQVETGADAGVMQGTDQSFEVGQGAQTGIRVAVVVYGVATVAVTGPAVKYRHQVQDINTQLAQVTDAPANTL